MHYHLRSTVRRQKISRCWGEHKECSRPCCTHWAKTSERTRWCVDKASKHSHVSKRTSRWSQNIARQLALIILSLLAISFACSDFVVSRLCLITLSSEKYAKPCRSDYLLDYCSFLAWSIRAMLSACLGALPWPDAFAHLACTYWILSRSYLKNIVLLFLTSMYARKCSIWIWY